MAANDINNRDVATIVNMNLSFQVSHVLSILLAVGAALTFEIDTSRVTENI